MLCLEGVLERDTVVEELPSDHGAFVAHIVGHAASEQVPGLVLGAVHVDILALPLAVPAAGGCCRGRGTLQMSLDDLGDVFLAEAGHRVARGTYYLPEM